MKRIFLTVDTESHNAEMENQYIWGEKNGKEYGLRRILELGREYKIPINFFVDFAEERRYGRQFIDRVVNLIKQYDQPVFLHLHPNYISGDDSKTYLWEYNRDEQRSILNTGIEIYQNIMGETPKAFRAGRYGVNKESYEIINELLPNVLEFSYTGGYGKMCHIEEELVKTKNHFVKYRSMGIMPNCSFVALDMFGIRKSIGVDTSEMSLIEFREFVKIADGKDFVLTMHSWNFIKKYFWSRKYVGRHGTNERLFKGMVKIARENGYEFAAIDKYDFEKGGSTEDIVYNACLGVKGKVRSIVLNFLRFQQMARISKKYTYIYAAIYLFLVVVLAIIGIEVFS